MALVWVYGTWFISILGFTMPIWTFFFRGMVSPCPSLFSPRVEKRLLPSPLSICCSVVMVKNVPLNSWPSMLSSQWNQWQMCVFGRYQVLVNAAVSVVWSLCFVNSPPSCSLHLQEFFCCWKDRGPWFVWACWLLHRSQHDFQWP